MEKGQSLFEVIVALVVISLVVVGAVSLSTTSLRNSIFARNDSVATKYAQEGQEWLRQQRDTDWDAFRTNVTNKSCLGSGFSTGSCTIDVTFSRSLSFICRHFDPGPPPTTSGPIACGNSSVNIVDSFVVVSWDDPQGTHSVSSVSSLTRWH